MRIDSWKRCALSGRELRPTAKHDRRDADRDSDCRHLRRKCHIITLNEAMRVIGAAQEKAAAIGQPMHVAVADAGGNLVAHVRMDRAWIGSIDISIKKAFTARAFDIATKDLALLAQPGRQFFGISASNDGRVTISRVTSHLSVQDRE